MAMAADLDIQIQNLKSNTVLLYDARIVKEKLKKEDWVWKHSQDVSL